MSDIRLTVDVDVSAASEAQVAVVANISSLVEASHVAHVGLDTVVEESIPY